MKWVQRKGVKDIGGETMDIKKRVEPIEVGSNGGDPVVLLAIRHTPHVQSHWEGVTNRLSCVLL